MRFQLGLDDADIQRFSTQKLREIVLAWVGEAFPLSFLLSGEAGAAEEGGAELAVTYEVPGYVRIDPVEGLAPASGVSAQRQPLTL